MKRKKWLALMMAAALTITGTGQTAGVLAAEFTDAGFTDAEEYVSPQAVETVSEQGTDAGNIGETAQWEDADIFSSDAEESDAEPDIAEEPEEDQEFLNMEEDIFQVEGPEESDELELPDADESEEELFLSEEPEEAFADGEDEEILSAGAVKADYSGVLISKAEFENLIQTGECPDGEWVQKKGTSFANFMKNFANKTGYLLVAAGNNEGYEDMVIPEGLTVVIACGAAINIKSITPNGNLYVWENVFTPGTLEIKSGKGSVTFKDSPVKGNVTVTGSVTFKDSPVEGNVTVTGSVTFRNCQVFGTVSGKGSNDTVTFAGQDNFICGLQGVENVVFSEQGNDLRIGESGKVEFYNIKNETDTDNNRRDRNIYLFIEGYFKDSVPVFHKRYDLGKTYGVMDDGTVGEWDAGVSVEYIKTFDVGEDGEWKSIDIGAGNPAVKFTGLSDVDILPMCCNMWGGGDGRYGIDIDGTTISHENSFFASVYQSSDGVSGAEVFDRFGRDDIPDGCFGEWGAASNSLKNMMRILEAAQKSGEGEGYYWVRLPRNYKGTETLTVPASLKGVLYSADDNYNEETDVYTIYPAQVSSVDVPSGKTVHLLNLTGGTGTLKITGAGKAALIYCRMNQDVTAGNLVIEGTTVKSLTCNKLSSERTWFAVEKSLKFNEASLLGTDVIAKAGAVLNLGAINNAGTNKGDITIDLEVKGGKTAAVSFAKAFNLGNVVWDDGSGGEASMEVRYYDYAKAAALGANCARDLYDIDYMPWDEEGKNIYEILAGFENKAASLMSFSEEAMKNAEYMMSHLVVYYDRKTLDPKLDKAKSNRVPLYIGYDNGESVATNAYITVNMVPKKDAKATVGTLKYKVTKSATKNGTVSVIAPANKNSTSITIPATVKINGYTFNVTAIASNAFKSCTKLTKVTIGSKVTSIGTQAFYGCKNLKTITVNTSGLKTVGKNALKGINAKAVISVSYAKLSAYKKLFSGKGQSSTVTISNPVPAKGKTVQSGALKYTITKSASKNGTVKVAAPVKNTNTSITIPSTVKIEGYTFKVTAIAASAFKNNTKLTKATLGANLTTIGKEAFYGCKSLKTITVKTKSLKSVGANALKGINAKATIKVPSAKLTAYKTLLKGKGQSSSVKITK